MPENTCSMIPSLEVW